MSAPEGTTAQLDLIYRAVDYFTTEKFEGQNRSLTLEMSQQMLADVIEGRGLAPLADYVKRFCDVIDGSGDAERIAAEILAAE